MTPCRRGSRHPGSVRFGCGRNGIAFHPARRSVERAAESRRALNHRIPDADWIPDAPDARVEAGVSI